MVTVNAADSRVQAAGSEHARTHAPTRALAGAGAVAHAAPPHNTHSHVYDHRPAAGLPEADPRLQHPPQRWSRKIQKRKMRPGSVDRKRQCEPTVCSQQLQSVVFNGRCGAYGDARTEYVRAAANARRWSYRDTL